MYKYTQNSKQKKQKIQHKNKRKQEKQLPNKCYPDKSKKEDDAKSLSTIEKKINEKVS